MGDVPFFHSILGIKPNTWNWLIYWNYDLKNPFISGRINVILFSLILAAENRAKMLRDVRVIHWFRIQARPAFVALSEKCPVSKLVRREPYDDIFPRWEEYYTTCENMYVWDHTKTGPCRRSPALVLTLGILMGEPAVQTECAENEFTRQGRFSQGFYKRQKSIRTMKGILYLASILITDCIALDVAPMSNYTKYTTLILLASPFISLSLHIITFEDHKLSSQHV